MHSESNYLHPREDDPILEIDRLDKKLDKTLVAWKLIRCNTYSHSYLSELS
jgi:hypothetical protein